MDLCVRHLGLNFSNEKDELDWDAAREAIRSESQHRAPEALQCPGGSSVVDLVLLFEVNS
jgi:hypothetical protein